jgi:pyroglutamyl-peptidase
MKVLFSGFEAFGGHDQNPTALLVSALEKGVISIPEEMTVDQIILPVTFQDSYKHLEEEIIAFNPDIIICFGLAEKRDSLSLESVAVNLMDARIPDNKGDQPVGKKISHGGADRYLSTLPLAGFEGALKQAGISVAQSQNAGEYVCNYLFYKLM